MPLASVPAETQQEIIRLYVEEHLSCRAIGERLFWSEAAVMHALVRHGIPRRPRGGGRRQTPVPEDVQREMVRLYVDEKLTIRQIGVRFGWGITAVRNRLLAHGVQIRHRAEIQRPRRGKVTPTQREQIVELYRDGLSSIDIGRRLGVSPTTVAYHLHRAGVDTRPRTSACALARRRRLATERYEALTPRQRATVQLLERTDRPLLTTELAVKLRLSTVAINNTLDRLEALGLVSHMRGPGKRGRPYRWRRTALPVVDVLAKALEPPQTGKPRAKDAVPIEPLRAWLNELVEREERKAKFMAVTSSADGADGSAGLSVLGEVAKACGIHERRLHALRFGQQHVSVSVADRLLTQADRGVTVFDLWPHLDVDVEPEEAMAA